MGTILGNRTATCTARKNVLYENVMRNRKQLSRILSSDLVNNCSAIISTENAPKNTLSDQCFMAEAIDNSTTASNSTKKRKRNKYNSDVPLSTKNLHPVTIMVVDTIGTVKSRRLLKVLLDSGSTTTLINKRCLPRTCKPCPISQSRMVNTLAGSYQSSAMVIMRNIRLPELDKNRNVDQQKALTFESATCKYDVILGADFLTKTGIDVKYSTGTIEWFENELPLRNPHVLKD